jgi:uncharacterized Zn finger protein
MSHYYGGWAPYVPVAARRAQAEREVEKLRKKGVTISPVKLAGKKIASTFWGKAWCDNLESYHDFENRLPRGRTYIRNGSVIDLQIAPREITAMVSGSSIYRIKITIAEVVKAHWTSICNDCSGGIDSLVELLQGRFSKGVMERICRQGAGLFPKPSDIRFSCSCPDYASMCKHIAAALYGVGARLDAKPELLFRLRAVNEHDLVADIGKVLPMTKQGPAAGKVLESDDMAALFGLDMGDEPVVVAPVGNVAAAAAARKKPAGRAKSTSPKLAAPPKKGARTAPAAPKKTAAKKTTPKKTAATAAVAPKRATRAVAASPPKTEPQPVEWWKPGALKNAGKVKVATLETTKITRTQNRKMADRSPSRGR